MENHRACHCCASEEHLNKERFHQPAVIILFQRFHRRLECGLPSEAPQQKRLSLCRRKIDEERESEKERESGGEKKHKKNPGINRVGESGSPLQSQAEGGRRNKKTLI